MILDLQEDINVTNGVGTKRWFQGHSMASQFFATLLRDSLQEFDSLPSKVAIMNQGGYG